MALRPHSGLSAVWLCPAIGGDVLHEGGMGVKGNWVGQASPVGHWAGCDQGAGASRGHCDAAGHAGGHGSNTGQGRDNLAAWGYSAAGGK